MTEVVHQHLAPIRHLYPFPALGDEEAGIALYRGHFELNSDAWDGDIHLDTRKQPELVASGARNSRTLAEMSIAGIEAFFLEDAHWQESALLSVPDVDGVPAPPTVASADGDPLTQTGAADLISRKGVGTVEVGRGEQLERVSFLVPNGRLTADGWIVCDEDRALSGAVCAEVDGWSIRIDPRTDARKSVIERRQRETAAHVFTHVGEIRRSDGSEFTSSDGEEILGVVGTALTLYLGRATACLLPVGWHGDTAAWARWGGDRTIDRRESDFNWFDQADGSATLGELIQCCVSTAHRGDGLWDAVQLAVGYLLSAHKSTVQMRVSLPVAAIGLVAEEWKVSYAPAAERRSRASMQAIGAADKFRMMLDVIGASPAVPKELIHLQDVRDALQAAADAKRVSMNQSSGGTLAGQNSPALVDAVKCVIALRNEVEHPGKRRHVQRDVRQWAEAGFFATDALLLSILFLLGFCGKVLPLSSSSRQAGSGVTVPWAL